MVSEYLVAPDGRAQFARWRCYARCPAQDYHMTRDDAREQAAAHVRETGHTVRVEHGTAEWLYGMAQALPPRPELTGGAA